MARNLLMGIVMLDKDDGIDFNPETDTIYIEGKEFALDTLFGKGLGGETINIEMTFNVTGTYDEVNGKFSKVLGNVAIVDCNYFGDLIFPAFRQAIKYLEFTHPIEYI